MSYKTEGATGRLSPPTWGEVHPQAGLAAKLTLAALGIILTAGSVYFVALSPWCISSVEQFLATPLMMQDILWGIVISGGIFALIAYAAPRIQRQRNIWQAEPIILEKTSPEGIAKIKRGYMLASFQVWLQ